MKKLFALILILILLLCACGTDFEPEHEWKPGTDEEPVAPEEQFYPHSYKSYELSNHLWNSDNSFTFQDKNALVTLNAENEVSKRVEISKAPENFEDYALYSGGKYIFAANRNPESREGVFYHTYNGKVLIANTALYSAEGEFIKEYPRGENVMVDGVITLPVDSNDIAMASRKIGPYIMAWKSDTEAYINFYYGIGIYDFEEDRGKMLWNAKTLKKELGADTVDLYEVAVLGEKLFITVKEFYSDKSKEYILAVTEEGTERICSGKVLFSDGENLLIRQPDGIYIITESEPKPKKICEGIDAENFFSNDGIISFCKYAYYGEEGVFYSYDLENGKTSVFNTEITTSLTFLGAKRNGNTCEYYFFTHSESTGKTLWRCNESDGYMERLAQCKGNQNNVILLSPSCEVYLEEKTVGEESFIRVGKIPPAKEIEISVPAEDEITDISQIPDEFTYEETVKWVQKSSEDYSPEEIELFLMLNGRDYSAEDLFGNVSLQLNFDRKCKIIKYWCSLSKEELFEICGDVKYKRIFEAPESGNTVFVLYDEGAYYSPDYYILHNAKTGENKLIYAFGYNSPYSDVVGNILVINERTGFTAFDLETGGEVEPPVEFNFESTDKNNSRFVVMQLAYDKEAEKTVLVYYDKETEGENRFARIMLGVFEKDGKLIKTVDTGTDAMVELGHFQLSPQELHFPEKGKIKMLLSISKHGTIAYECNYLEASEKPEVSEIPEIWDKIEGNWYCYNGGERWISFHISNGKAAFSYRIPSAEWNEEFLTAYTVTKVEQLSDTEYAIYGDDGNGHTPVIYINTDKPGDNKMLVGTKTNKYFDEYEYVE